MTATEAAATFYRDDDYQLQESVGQLLTRLRSLVDRDLERRLTPFKVTPAQFRILVKLAYGNIEHAADLCRELNLDSGSTTRMIDRLEDKGLVQRSACPEDRRAYKLELTAAGRELADAKIPAVAAATNNHFLRGFSEVDFETLKRLLRRMVDNA